MKDQKLKKLVTAALLAAMTCIATMMIKIPTPTMGYIHPGDCFVLLCGVVLGPCAGALAAGIGSMLSDIFSGYLSWAPATLLIKALTAAAAGILFRRLLRNGASLRARSAALVCGGILGEAVMVIGYFFYETGLAAFGSGALSAASIGAGALSAAAGIPFNLVQGAVGILLAVLLLPILSQVPDVRDWIQTTEPAKRSLL